MSVTATSVPGLLISTATTGPLYGNNAPITVTRTGTVTAMGFTNPLWTAFETTAGNTITFLQNDGMVTARATAVYGNQAISQITNNGTFLGNSGIENFGGGSIAALQNNATGLISGSSYWGIRNTGTGSLITSLANSGTVSAAYVGVRNEYGGTVASVTNSNLIRGTSFDAIQNVEGTITQITNSGTLNGQGRSGIQNEAQLGGTAVIGSITKTYWELSVSIGTAMEQLQESE